MRGGNDTDQLRLDRLRDALAHLHSARAALEAAGGRRCAEEIRRAIEYAEAEIVEVHKPGSCFRLRR